MRIDAKTSEYFLELLRSALHDRPALPKPQDVSWYDIFEFAKSQSLSYMAYCAIRKSGFDISDELKQEWSTNNSRILVSYFNQEYECDRLCRELSDAGIRNMPLKGSVICKLFPAPEMREMCDLDILVKPEDLERVHNMMLADGYSYIEDHTTSHNREYHKLPYLNVEIHTYLVAQENRMFSYYSDYWGRAAYEDDGLICRMPWDDCYIFMMAHSYKHFFAHGTGIRSVLDVYIMRDKLKDVLHLDFIAGELKKLGIIGFAESFERLAAAWFAGETTELPEELQHYHYRVLESGTYGDNAMKSTALKIMQDGKSFRTAKLIMAFSKVFPSYSNMKLGYPCLKYVPFLLPLFWVVRWIKTVLVMPKKISAFFKKLRGLSLSGDGSDSKERR